MFSALKSGQGRNTSSERPLAEKNTLPRAGITKKRDSLYPAAIYSLDSVEKEKEGGKAWKRKAEVQRSSTPLRAAAGQLLPPTDATDTDR